MTLWHNDAGEIFGDGSSLIGPDGTFYPSGWNKDDLPFLTRVVEVDQPSGPNVVVTGWHLEGSTQVWDTRPKSADELAQEAAQAKQAHNAPIYAALEAIDKRTIRPIREGDSTRVAALEAEAAALRAQLMK